MLARTHNARLTPDTGPAAPTPRHRAIGRSCVLLRPGRASSPRLAHRQGATSRGAAEPLNVLESQTGFPHGRPVRW
jgi:hypothetical protein